MTTRRWFKCKFCGLVLPAWLPVAQAPDGALRLAPLGRRHPDQAKPYLDRVYATEDIDAVVVEAYEVVEDQGEASCITRTTSPGP